jgi:hypothetical protein
VVKNFKSFWLGFTNSHSELIAPKIIFRAYLSMHLFKPHLYFEENPDFACFQLETAL